MKNYNLIGAKNSLGHWKPWVLIELIKIRSEGATYREIGENLGVTTVRARQIVLKAVRQARRGKISCGSIKNIDLDQL